MQPPLHPHHPFRYIVLLGFLAMIFISSDKAGQSEIVRVAAEQTALYSQARAADLPGGPMLIEIRDDTAASPASDSIVVEPAQSVPLAAVPAGHLATPVPLHAVYLTGSSAGSEKGIARVMQLVDERGVNAIVIDIKDASGKLSYQPEDPKLIQTGVGTGRIRDLPSLIDRLHEKNIYVIGRIAVFQDPFYAAAHPEDAFLDIRTGALWRDYKGIAWLKPYSKSVWDYTAAIARDAYAQGFDEINLDYVRFPSDGELSFLDRSDQNGTRTEVVQSFFVYLDPLLRSEGIVLSADLFGLTMSANDDLGIGQKLEAVAPYVDYVCPMVYPSHFAAGAYGIADPAAHPYEIIKTSLSRGIKKLETIGLPKETLRPWLQDFNLGAIYTSDMVRAQIDAAEELELPSWMLWNPRNRYTETALTPLP